MTSLKLWMKENLLFQFPFHRIKTSMRDTYVSKYSRRTRPCGVTNCDQRSKTPKVMEYFSNRKLLNAINFVCICHECLVFVSGTMVVIIGWMSRSTHTLTNCIYSFCIETISRPCNMSTVPTLMTMAEPFTSVFTNACAALIVSPDLHKANRSDDSVENISFLIFQYEMSFCIGYLLRSGVGSWSECRRDKKRSSPSRCVAFEFFSLAS